MSGEITPVFYLALLAIAGWGVYLQMRHYSLPVHADSGEFIYRGVLEREGEKFQVMDIKMPWKELLTVWRHWSVDSILQGYPAIQNKILVYQTMTWFFRNSQFQAKDFRLLLGLYHGCTILTMGALPLKEFNDLRAGWFNQGRKGAVDTLTQGGVTRLLQDWRTLNASGSWRQSLPRLFGESPG